MSRRDPLASAFGFLLSAPKPDPMTNAGRYLRQLSSGDVCFERNGEAIDDELICALKRIQIVTAKEARA